jgi:hypothetical protein
MSAPPAPAQPPWYREPFVWMLIAIPLTAVVVGMIMLYFAVTTYDGLVVDDYYQHGKEINLTLHRDQAARRHGLAAELELDSDAGIADVVLRAASGLRLPEAVTLRLWHATRAGFDQVVPLAQGRVGRYRGAIAPLAPGHWHVQIEADDWRLTGSIRQPGAARLALRPDEPPPAP